MSCQKQTKKAVYYCIPGACQITCSFDLHGINHLNWGKESRLLYFVYIPSILRLLQRYCSVALRHAAMGFRLNIFFCISIQRDLTQVITTFNIPFPTYQHILRDFKNAPFYILCLFHMVDLMMFSLSFFSLLQNEP